MRIAYPVQFTQLASGIEAALPDVPGASATASNREQARAAASARLLEVLRSCVKERADIPMPRCDCRHRDEIAPSALIAAKLALYQTMRDQSISNVALAQRLGTVEGTVRRLLDTNHRSHIGAVEVALALLGKRLVVEVLAQAR